MSAGQPGTVARVETYVVRVWLPDRPGALGQVASRIGALRGDLIGIDILERGGGRAVDELVVSVPDGSSVDLLVAEIVQVDDVAVEDIRRVDNDDRGDAGMIALEIAVDIAESSPADRVSVLCRCLLDLLDGDWVTAFDPVAGRSFVAVGAIPEACWLSAFIGGSEHLDERGRAVGSGDELAWARLTGLDVIVAIGRTSRPFHTRERQRVSLLCRMVGALCSKSVVLAL